MQRLRYHNHEVIVKNSANPFPNCGFKKENFVHWRECKLNVPYLYAVFVVDVYLATVGTQFQILKYYLPTAITCNTKPKTNALTFPLLLFGNFGKLGQACLAMVINLTRFEPLI